MATETERPTAQDVFDAYADMVYRLAFARTGNRYDADDVLQETFLRYLRYAAQLESDAHRKAWLIRTAISCSNSLLRSAWRRRTVALPDTLCTELREHSEVYAAVLSLSRKDRTVIHLYYYEGYSVAEIAELLQTRPGTVKSRLHRARARLAELLKGDLPDVSRELSSGQ